MKRQFKFWVPRHLRSSRPVTDKVLDETIEPGAKNLKRVMCLFTKPAHWASSESTSPATTEISEYFDVKKGINLEISGKKLYENNLNSDYLIYQNLRNETRSGVNEGSAGTVCTYKAFKDGYLRYYVFNLEHCPLVKNPDGVSIRIIGDKNVINGSAELHFFLETESIINIDMTNSANTSVST